MFRLIRASFNQRRKTLANGLKNSPELDYTKEEIEAAIEALGRGASIRGEALTLERILRSWQICCQNVVSKIFRLMIS